MMMNTDITIDALWQLLKDHQTEIFLDRRSKSITKATFEQALNKLKTDKEQIKGPKSLNVFGAPYVWAILKTFEIV